VIDPHAHALMRALQRDGPTRFSSLLTAVRNRRTLSAKLRQLQEAGWVAKGDDGYRLTARGEKSASLLQELEALQGPAAEPDVDRVPHPYYRPVLKVLAERLLDRFGEQLLGLLLFGSVARGDWTEDSDIDLLVLLEAYPDGTKGALGALLKVRKSLRGTPEYRRAFRSGFVPTVTFYPVDLEDSSRFRRMYLDAFTEGLILYERDGALTALLDRFREALREAGAVRVDRPGVGHYWVLEDATLMDGSI
jgi:predicted nucleotidyltransferase